MKDEESIPVSPAKPAKVTPSVLEAFDNLKSPREDIRLDGGTKIVSMIQGNEVRIIKKLFFIPFYVVKLYFYIVNLCILNISRMRKKLYTL